MINFFKKLKNKIYYSYFDKVVNSEAEIKKAVEMESHEIVVDMQQEEISNKVVINFDDITIGGYDLDDKEVAPIKQVAKKPGRPKGTASKAPVKKAPAKKQAPKKNPS